MTKQKKYFGTDGIRATSNQFPMTPIMMVKLATSLAYKFKFGSHRHKVVIGKDTRLSGYMIEPALTSGFVSAGMDVFLVGPLPTPAISMLTKSLRADIGIMISASHNPFYDNGVKIFDRDGNKLTDQTELEIEKLMDSDIDKMLAKPHELGRAIRIDDAKGRYIEYVKNSFDKNLILNNIKIVIDCANGAAYNIAPTIFTELGANIITIANKPDGFNINDKSGSMDTESLSNTILKENADIGIALDGDADRLVILDEFGNKIDGDHIIASIAIYLKKNNLLYKDTIIVNDMSNNAMEKFLKKENINIEKCNIGDRYIIEKINKFGYNFGAEKSGHIIYSNYSKTGDGIVAALQILQILIKENKRVSDLGKLFKLYPQKLLNIKIDNDNNLLNNKSSLKEIEKIKQNYPDYKILIRKSGTENLIRILVEGPSENIASHILAKLKEIKS